MFRALLVTLIAQPEAEVLRSPIWATIEKVPTASRRRVKLEFGTLGPLERNSNRLAYYARQTVREDGAPDQTRWADSLNCPALTAAIAELRDLPTPRIDIPGFPPQSGGIKEGLAFDGINYSLSMWGRLSFSMNTDSALSRWIERTLARLQSC